MRKVVRSIRLLALMLSVPRAALAANIVVGDTVTIQQAIEGAGAGPFIGIVNGDPASTFMSLCLQAEVGSWDDLGSPLIVSGISDSATWQSTDVGGNDDGKDPISSQTAWLYTQYREGTLAGMDDSVDAANALQFAVWQLEDERLIPDDREFTDLANSFIALANEAVANGFTGLGEVRVLNLTNPDGTDAQDQLTMLPEPSSLELAALGAMVLYAGRRRYAMDNSCGIV